MDGTTVWLARDTKLKLDELRHDGQSRGGVIAELIDYFLVCEGLANMETEQGEPDKCPTKA